MQCSCSVHRLVSLKTPELTFDNAFGWSDRWRFLLQSFLYYPSGKKTQQTAIYVQDPNAYGLEKNEEYSIWGRENGEENSAFLILGKIRKTLIGHSLYITGPSIRYQDKEEKCNFHLVPLF